MCKNVFELLYIKMEARDRVVDTDNNINVPK